MTQELSTDELTKDMWDKPETEIFTEKAIKMGAPLNKIIIEGVYYSSIKRVIQKKTVLQGRRESNPQQRFWRPLLCHLTTPLVFVRFIITQSQRKSLIEKIILLFDKSCFSRYSAYEIKSYLHKI